MKKLMFKSFWMVFLIAPLFASSQSFVSAGGIKDNMSFSVGQSFAYSSEHITVGIQIVKYRIIEMPETPEIPDTSVVDSSGVDTAHVVDPVVDSTHVASDYRVEYNISAHPNPTSGRVTISSGGDYIECVVISTCGVVLESISGNGINLDLSSYSGNLFFISVKIDGKEVKKLKVIKQ